MSIVDVIYNSERFSDVPISEMSQEYRKTFDRLCSLESALLEKFPQCGRLFREYQNSEIDLTDLAKRESFESGVNAGARLVLESNRQILRPSKYKNTNSRAKTRLPQQTFDTVTASSAEQKQ